MDFKNFNRLAPKLFWGRPTP